MVCLSSDNGSLFTSWCRIIRVLTVLPGCGSDDLREKPRKDCRLSPRGIEGIMFSVHLRFLLLCVWYHILCCSLIKKHFPYRFFFFISQVCALKDKVAWEHDISQVFLSPLSFYCNPSLCHSGLFLLTFMSYVQKLLSSPFLYTYCVYFFVCLVYRYDPGGLTFVPRAV